jgi:hypothetical protein
MYVNAAAQNQLRTPVLRKNAGPVRLAPIIADLPTNPAVNDIQPSGRGQPGPFFQMDFNASKRNWRLDRRLGLLDADLPDL